MFCTKCGAVVDEKTGVCPNCGACERAEEKAEKPDFKKKLHLGKATKTAKSYAVIFSAFMVFPAMICTVVNILNPGDKFWAGVSRFARSARDSRTRDRGHLLRRARALSSLYRKNAGAYQLVLQLRSADLRRDMRYGRADYGADIQKDSKGDTYPRTALRRGGGVSHLP